jgi:hypothetical protein
MFMGDLSFHGSAILSDVVILVGFLTTVLHFAQEDTLEIPLLDMIQTLLCWPSFFEGGLITICLWSFRHIERMLGFRGTVIFLAYQALTYLVPFLLVLKFKGFHAHFSLLNFLPYSFYIFMFWRFPSVLFADPLTDKFAVSLSMFLIILARLPYSIFALSAAIGGYYLWTFDLLKIRALLSPRPTTRVDRPIEVASPPALDWPAAQTDETDGKIREMIAMGFTEADARAALSNTRGDVQQAVESMLHT